MRSRHTHILLSSPSSIYFSLSLLITIDLPSSYHHYYLLHHLLSTQLGPSSSLPYGPSSFVVLRRRPPLNSTVLRSGHRHHRLFSPMSSRSASPVLKEDFPYLILLFKSSSSTFFPSFNLAEKESVPPFVAVMVVGFCGLHHSELWVFVRYVKC